MKVNREGILITDRQECPICEESSLLFEICSLDVIECGNCHTLFKIEKDEEEEG